ncbi:type VI secretion system tip protein TssI/VgrG [Rahnella laticis]|uniref:type VI secretion system tip protein TssI/VgrG n=1 Tax=Rahnella laticis TaxID=2787622 RepID=UPI0018A282B1|nr:type VI secretion system tip protein TssI/VgrG [Rahnella laticis]MBF7994840.1 type VI secretion system tip protein VgrG [Rahnella laticis]
MAINGTRFTFTAGSTAKDTFAVVNFHLSQNYSELFTLNITLASSDPAVGFEKVLDENATLTIWQGTEIKRRVRGIVTFCEQGDTGKHQTLYRMTIRPNFWRSSLRTNCRSFQNLDIRNIFQPLLSEMEVIKYDTLFRASHSAREFCVQFMETDFDYISRLCAEEGIFFYEQEYLEANDQKLTFADNCSALTGIGSLPYNPNSATEADTYCINNFRRSARIRPSEVVTQDYTFTAPNWQAQYQQQPSKMKNQHDLYKIFDYPGRFKDEQHGADFAKYQIEGWRNNADVVAGRSNSPELSPGLCFSLTNHPREDLNVNWQVVSSELSGDQPQAWIGNEGQGTTLVNEFEVIPSTQTWRSMPHPKPRVDGPQIAIVTGPPGEEIFCDEHGRVRVKFAWDRYNKADNYSSCWIRVSQAWAGTGFGNIAVPRVGQEVIVDFLNGDPDQPIITGRTYHATNRAPGGLPGTKTQMAIRSQTYKGDGYNELMFEDATGNQLLSMQAQKDMKTKVLNDQTLTVDRHRVKTIKGNETNIIEGDRTKIVKGNETHAIEGFQGSTVKVGQSSAVKGDVAELTGGAFTSLAVKIVTLGSGELIRLECGESALELHASGAINLKGKSLNVTIEGNGVINTVGGVLGLNPSSPGSPASAPGESYKQSIQSSIDGIFNKESE